jgi:hypothetical protein
MENPSNSSQTRRIAASWLLVLIPLGWGVYQSLVKSLPLFQQTPTASSPSSSSAPR